MEVGGGVVELFRAIQCDTGMAEVTQMVAFRVQSRSVYPSCLWMAGIGAHWRHFPCHIAA